MGLTNGSTGRHAHDKMLLEKQPEDIVVALLGNPNTGKSTVFNALTGMNQHTGILHNRKRPPPGGRFPLSLSIQPLNRLRNLRNAFSHPVILLRDGGG